MEPSKFNVYIPLIDEEYLLFNSISKAIIRLEAQIFQSFLKGELNYWDPLTLRLISDHFYVDNSDKQYESLKSHDYAEKKSGNFHHLTIMLSEACNFSCDYCNQGSSKESLKISPDLFRQIENYVLSKANENSIVDISWFGGEPLLHSELLITESKRLKSILSSKNIKYKSRVLTNGFLLSDTLAIRLKEASVNGAQVSFDGYIDDHNSSRYVRKGIDTYNIILSNLYDVLNNVDDFAISLRINVTAKNIDGLESLIYDLTSRGFGQFQNFNVYWGHVYDPTKSKIPDAINIDELLLSHEKFAEAELKLNRLLRRADINASKTINLTQGNCLATQSSSLLIKPNGDLHKCYIPVSNEAYSVGNLEDYGSIKDNEIFNRWDSWTAFNESNCSGCRLLGSCRGGCPIKYIMDDYNQESYQCPPNKLRVNEHLFDLAKQLGIVSDENWCESTSATKLEKLRMSCSIE